MKCVLAWDPGSEPRGAERHCNTTSAPVGCQEKCRTARRGEQTIEQSETLRGMAAQFSMEHNARSLLRITMRYERVIEAWPLCGGATFKRPRPGEKQGRSGRPAGRESVVRGRSASNTWPRFRSTPAILLDGRPSCSVSLYASDLPSLHFSTTTETRLLFYLASRSNARSIHLQLNAESERQCNEWDRIIHSSASTVVFF